MSDEQYMMRAIQLAELGKGHVSPNPMVGCVVVYQNRIIGEGYHQQYGGPHAEVFAIGDVREPHLLSQATVYVTLEPCSHHGKTPPCADLLIQHRVQRVVVACQDPNPLVAGQGIAKLKAAGIDVDVGCCESESRRLNRRFLTFFEQKRPFVILKWAQTTDGFVARSDFSSKWISNEKSRQLVHKWRTEEDAILVGANTAKYDNPRLDARNWSGKNPIRVVLDRDLSLSTDLNVFNDSERTICITTQTAPQKTHVDYSQVSEFSAEAILEVLEQNKVQSVIVEGGTHTLNLFIKSGLWDEARVFVSAQEFQSGIAAPDIDAHPINCVKIGNDQMYTYENTY